jgi:uncharacterized protein (DUF58 family)
MIVPRASAIVLVGAGGGALALTAAVLPAATPALLALALLLILLLLFDAINAIREARGLSVTSPALVRTVRGRATPLPLTLSNRNTEIAGANAIRLALHLPDEVTAAEPTLDCGAHLASGQQVAVTADLCCSRRGDFHIERCTVRTRSRWALWNMQDDLALSTTLRAYPDLLGDRTAVEFLQRGKAGERMIRHSGKGREFEKLREYLAGDSFDEIDWKATARRGKPVVRVFQVERTQEIYVALDASRLSGRPAGLDRNPHELTLDRYVNAALVMALAAQAQGDRFGLITFSDRVHRFVRANKGRAHFKTCREAIYGLQPRAVEPDFGEFFAFLKTRLTRRALVIVLTSLDDPLAGETFSHYVAVASRRHLVIAGMPAPPGARPLFEMPAATVDDIYAGLSGHLRWRQVAELQKNCQRQGVALHLLSPDKLTAQLAGIYLDVKRRQTL